MYIYIYVYIYIHRHTHTHTHIQSTHDIMPPLLCAMKVCGQKIPVKEYFSVTWPQCHKLWWTNSGLECTVSSVVSPCNLVETDWCFQWSSCHYFLSFNLKTLKIQAVYCAGNSLHSSRQHVITSHKTVLLKFLHSI